MFNDTIKDDENPDFFDDFANYLLVIKNFSEIYIKNTITTLQQFLRFINIYKYEKKYSSIKQFTLNDIRFLNNSDIYSFIYFLAENNYVVGSRIQKMKHLHSFFDYLHRIQHSVFKQPFNNIKSEKDIYFKLPNYLSLNEGKKILKLYNNSTKIKEIRDNAILHLLLNCGLRVSEVHNLNITDFNFSNDTFLIFGKGSKEREGFLNHSTKESINKYLKLRYELHPKSNKDKNALFLSNKGNRISIRAIQSAVTLAYYKSDIGYNVYTAHTLRHTCATLLYKNGVDLNVIREILGHAQVDTTTIYTHLEDKEVREAILGHPLSQYKMQDALLYEYNEAS